MVLYLWEVDFYKKYGVGVIVDLIFFLFLLVIYIRNLLVNLRCILVI